MDYSKYKNTLPYPSKSEISKTLGASKIEEIDKKPMTREERELAYSKVEVAVSDEYKRLRDAYYVEEGRLTSLFWEDAEQECRTQNLPEGAKQKLRGAAWDRGHSGGYYEVFGAYQELAETVLEILEICKIC